MIAPFGAGVMSTVGFLVAPLAFDLCVRGARRWTTLDWRAANALLARDGD